MDTLIRRYQAGDHKALCQLWSEVFPDPSPHNAPEIILRDKLAVQPELLFVAEKNGVLLGSIIAGYDGHRGWLNLVSVHPSERGSGLGSRLVDHAIEQLRGIGCRKVNIQIREGNEAVIAFYSKLGFETEARVSMGKFI